MQKIHAVVLSGGSAFGLEADSGVMRYLAEQGIGFPVGDSAVPIVCGAVLFDLSIGDPHAFPDLEMGIKAASAAGTDFPSAAMAQERGHLSENLPDLNMP